MAPWDGAWVTPLKHATPLTFVITPNLVALGKSVWVGRWSQKISGCWVPPDPLETYSYSTCVTLSNLVAVGQTVWAQVGVSKIWECLGPASLGWGRGWSLETSCYRTSNMIAVGQTVWAQQESQKYWGVGAPPLGKGVADPLETCSYPTCVIVSNLVDVGQTVLGVSRGPKNFWRRWGAVTPQRHAPPSLVLSCQFRSFQVKPHERNYRDPPNMGPCPAFSGHSTSPEPTRINQLPMTSYYYSIVTMGLSRTVSEKMAISEKKIPTPVFNALLMGFPLEFCNAGGVQKLE